MTKETQVPYVKISNKGTVHRKFLEIIGAGTKQAGERDTVGQFHSGFKMAVAAAMRLGLRIAVSSSDEDGPFILDFDTKEVNFEHNGKSVSAQLICYRYSSGDSFETSVALTAFHKWTTLIGEDKNETYPVLREIIANAADEDADFRIETGITEITQADGGCTAVYLEESPAVLDIIGNPGRYFKFLGIEPVFKIDGIGAIYPKSHSDNTRFFNQGYLVGCVSDFDEKTFFDYDAFGKDFISEERIVNDSWGYDRQIAMLFSRIRDKKLLRELIDSAADDPRSYERNIFWEICDFNEDFKALCQEIWVERYGEKAVLSGTKPEYDMELRSQGRTVVSLGYKLGDFFHKAGIRKSNEVWESVLKEIVCRPMTREERAALDRIAETYLGGIKFFSELFAKCPVSAFDDKSGIFRGITATDFSGIAIEAKVLNESDPSFLKTLMHELRHYRTHIIDTDYREFMRRADEEIVFLLQLLALALRKLREAGIDPAGINKAFMSMKKEGPSSRKATKGEEKDKK